MRVSHLWARHAKCWSCVNVCYYNSYRAAKEGLKTRLTDKRCILYITLRKQVLNCWHNCWDCMVVVKVNQQSYLGCAWFKIQGFLVRLVLGKKTFLFLHVQLKKVSLGYVHSILINIWAYTSFRHVVSSV